MASDLHVGFYFFVGDAEDCVGGFLYVKFDQPSLCPLIDLPECFCHSDSGCSDVAVVKMINSVGESTPPCDRPCFSVFFLLW